MAASIDGPRVKARSGQAKQLVVFLHGYGADGSDLIELGRQWQSWLPDAEFVAPHAPDRCVQSPSGRQWFPLSSRADEDRWLGVNQAAPTLNGFLDGELARMGLDERKLALVGFSQGTMMALHVGLRRTNGVAGILGYSGMLVGPEHLAALPPMVAPKKAPPVLLVHGDADNVIPVDALFAASDALSEAKIPTQWHLSLGVAHGIDQAGLRHGGQFLAQAFGLRTPAARREHDRRVRGIRRIIVILVLATLAAIVTMPMVYLSAAVLLGLVSVNEDYRPADNGIDVFIRSNGVHADLVLPLHAIDVDWETRLPLDGILPIEGGADSLAFGWGDRGFYIETPTWAELHASTAFVALMGLDPTVVHVEATTAPSPSETVRHLSLSPAQYHRLVAYIESALHRSPDGSAIVIPGARYGFHDAFFEALGRYSPVKTCNEWARRALSEAGVRVPLWSPFDKALLYQLPEEEMSG